MIRASKTQYKQGTIDALEESYSNYTVSCNTPICSIVRAGGFVTTNTIQHTGGVGATDNIFTFSGCVRVLELYGICTSVSDATTFGSFKFEIDDGGAQSDLTTGVAAAGIVAGGLLLKENDSSSATIFKNPSTALVVDAVSKQIFEPTILIQKTGDVTSYVRASYTGDASTDITIEYHIRWSAMNSDANVEAV